MSSPHPIDHDLACYNCGYNLRTLLPSARCPECGRPVQQSIRIAELVDPDSGYAFKGLGGCGALGHDLACDKCGRNLRNCRPTDRCPGCGYPILRSIAAAEIKARKLDHMFQRRAAADVCLHIVAGASGFSIHAVRFVLNAIVRHRRAGGKLLPRAICLAVRDFALAHFHNDAIQASQALIDWKLADSDHIGQVVAALIEIGVLQPGTSTSPQAFKALFDHQQLMAAS